MKRRTHRHSTLAFLLAIAGALASCTNQQPSDHATLVFEIRPEVNYVTHLYTLARLGFSDEEYAATYGNTLPQAAIDTLQHYKDYLVFGQGEGGTLAWPFFFGVSQGTFANADSLQLWIDAMIEEGRQAEVPPEVMSAAQAVARVYTDNYDHYMQHVYPQAKRDMEERRQLLTRTMQPNNLVNQWERQTGYTWQHGDYHWLLYRAGQQGPSYNNLDEHTNTVYYNQPIGYQTAMFSHEFGIFLMQDSIQPIFDEMKAYVGTLDTERDLTFVPWSAFESLACWYNCRIAGQETEDRRNFGEADVERFCSIYDQLSASGTSDPAGLYRKGIMQYLQETVLK